MNTRALTPPLVDEDIIPAGIIASGQPPLAVVNGASSLDVTAVYNILQQNLTTLVSQKRVDDIIRICEEADIEVEGDINETRFCSIAPLVLSYLANDNLPHAQHSLNRISKSLFTHSLYLSLRNLLLSTWNRKYVEVYKHAEEVINLVQHPSFFDSGFASTLKTLTTLYLDTFRMRTFVLLSKAYTSISLNLARSYLGQPTENIISSAKENGWSYNPPTQILVPVRALGANTKSFGIQSSASSLSTFDRIVDINARLESVL